MWVVSGWVESVYEWGSIGAIFFLDFPKFRVLEKEMEWEWEWEWGRGF